MFSQAGYEFCGIDQKGFGKSEGARGRIEGFGSVVNDIQKFNEEYCKQYDTSGDTPKFLLGHSMGGLVSTFLAANQDTSNLKYDGVCVAAPYFDLYDKDMLTKMKAMVTMLNAVSPNKMIPFGSKSIKAHLQQWKTDEFYLGDHISPHTILENEKAMSVLKNEQTFSRVTIPTLILKCGLDKMVCNSSINKFFEEIPIRDKMMITYDDVDHSLFQDGEYISLIMKDVVDWLDTHTK
jgi:acylglycerol lipase